MSSELLFTFHRLKCVGASEHLALHNICDTYTAGERIEGLKEFGLAVLSAPTLVATQSSPHSVTTSSRK